MRTTLAALFVGALLAEPASAQVEPLNLQVHRGRLRDAGTFHWATKTWTRAGARSQKPDVFAGAVQTVYDNTCFWTGLAANTLRFNGIEPCQDVYDEGRIPATGPAGATSDVNVFRFQFGHVTFAPLGTVDVELTFYDFLGGNCVGGMSPTMGPGGGAGEPSFAGRVRLNTANGVTLPGDPGGTGTAWIVDIDLSIAEAFCLQADGDGTTGNGNDLFTWRFRHYNSIPPFAMNEGGPIVAGELLKGGLGACTYGMTGAQACGTDPNGVGPCGTGLGGNDSFWENLDGDVANGGSNNSSASCPQTFGTACFFFGGWPGNPWSSYFLTITSNGSCNSCFASICPAIFYCVGKTTSAGCVPFLTTNGSASASFTGPFFVRSNDNIPDEAGLLLYGYKKSNLGFHGGKLCVKAPITRTGAKQAKAATCIDPGGTCTTSSCGFLNRNFNTVIQGGNDPMLTAGQNVFAQWRQRDPADPAGFGDNLSHAITFVIQP